MSTYNNHKEDLSSGQVATHPMGRAHKAVGPARAGTQVVGLNWQTLAVKARHGRTTGRAVIHIAYVSFVIQKHVAPTIKAKDSQPNQTDSFVKAKDEP